MRTTNNFDRSKLIANLAEKEFPIDYDQSVFFRFFPFSNELHFISCFNDAMEKFKLSENKINAAVLFGESHFLSLLPELVNKRFDIVFLADIHPAMHLHTKHLLTCLEKSNNIDEFVKCYYTELPERCRQVLKAYGKDCDEYKNLDEFVLNLFKNLLIEENECRYFLYNEERYQLCKLAMKKITFCNIELNLLNTKQCYRFMSLLNNNNANLVFANMNNIHYFDKESMLNVTAPLLLYGSKDCIIINSASANKVNKSSFGAIQYLDRLLEDDFIPSSPEEIKKFKKLQNILAILKQFVSQNEEQIDHNLINKCREVINEFQNAILKSHRFKDDDSFNQNIKLALSSVNNLIVNNFELNQFKITLKMQSIFRAKKAIEPVSTLVKNQLGR